MSNRVVVGLTGKAATGKDTVGDYLVSHYRFTKDSFASPLKRLVGDIFGVPMNILCPESPEEREQREKLLEGWGDWSARKLLQYIGTELFRRHIDRDVWVKSFCQRMTRDGDKNYVVTDIRFPNELDFLRGEFANSFVSINMHREGCDGNTEGGIKAHESEAYNLRCDYDICNDSSFEDLYAEIDLIMKREFAKGTVECPLSA